MVLVSIFSITCQHARGISSLPKLQVELDNCLYNWVTRVLHKDMNCYPPHMGVAH